MRQPLYGFTLLELLVVVTIIVILISLLAPALDKAVRQGEIARCGSNLHQIAMGIKVYAIENSRRFPQYRSAAETPATGSVFQNHTHYLWGNNRSDLAQTRDRLMTKALGEKVAECPTDAGYQAGSPNSSNGKSFYKFFGNSYTYNIGLLDSTSTNTEIGLAARTVLWGAKLSHIDNPSSLVMAGDITNYYPMYFTFGRPPHLLYLRQHDPIRYESNMAFVDGHVASELLLPPPSHIFNGAYHMVKPQDFQWYQ